MNKKIKNTMTIMAVVSVLSLWIVRTIETNKRIDGMNNAIAILEDKKVSLEENYNNLIEENTALAETINSLESKVDELIAE